MQKKALFKNSSNFSKSLISVVVLSVIIFIALVSALPAVSYASEQWVARYHKPTESINKAKVIAVDVSGNTYVSGTSYGSSRDYETIKYDSQGNELWTAIYDADDYEYVTDMAIDSFGNVYVTGDSDEDYATIKYDTNGNVLWVARYEGASSQGGSFGDYAKAIVVDSSGNVYVTGTSAGSCATVKYDTNGNELWRARYIPPGYTNYYATDIALDATGNVYITGYSGGAYLTITYDINGNESWVRTYKPVSSINEAHAIAVDTSGNIYVTGHSEVSATSYDYATIKYDQLGNELWVSRYNGPWDLSDKATAIAVDTSENVIVTGESYGPGTGPDYLTVKYDTNGNELWKARYDGEGDAVDSSNALTLDTSGNIYVTGKSKDENADYDFITIKYHSSGTELWKARYNALGNSDDYAAAITVDASGNVYVTGESNGDYATIKYDTDGSEQWDARSNWLGNSQDYAEAVAVDTSGNIYVTGMSDEDYATAKYDADGNEQWIARYNSQGNGVDSAKAIAVDASGNAYVTGTSDKDYATIKYDTDGNELWVARYNGPGNSIDYAEGIAVDGFGRVYVIGTSNGVSTYSDYAVIKYAANGNELWVARYSGPGYSRDYAKAIVIDFSGNVYVTGSICKSGSSALYDDYATIKYDTNGNEQWVAMYNGTANSKDRAMDIASDFSGNVYVTGHSRGSLNGDEDFATIKYDTNGNELWVARYGQGNNRQDFANAIAIDPSGNVLVAGYSDSYSYYDSDYATVKYDVNGNEQWAAIYNGPGNHNDLAVDILSDPSGNVLVTGYSETYTYKDTDYATIKYDPSGNELWAAIYDGPGNHTDKPSAIAVDKTGNVYVIGYSDGIGTEYDYATIKYGCSTSPSRIAYATPVYFDYLQNAYDTAGTNDTIQSREYVFLGDLIVRDSKAVTLQAGYDCDYSSNTGRTIIDDMVVSKGLLVIESGMLELGY